MLLHQVRTSSNLVNWRAPPRSTRQSVSQPKNVRVCFSSHNHDQNLCFSSTLNACLCLCWDLTSWYTCLISGSVGTSASKDVPVSPVRRTMSVDGLVSDHLLCFLRSVHYLKSKCDCLLCCPLSTQVDSSKKDKSRFQFEMKQQKLLEKEVNMTGIKYVSETHWRWSRNPTFTPFPPMQFEGRFGAGV